MTLANRGAAIRLYETLVEKHPNSSTAWYAKGLALTRLKLYNQAMDCFRTSIKNNPKAAGGFKGHTANVANNK